MWKDIKSAVSQIIFQDKRVFLTEIISSNIFSGVFNRRRIAAETAILKYKFHDMFKFWNQKIKIGSNFILKTKDYLVIK